MDQELDIIQSDNGLLADIRSMVEQTRTAVARIVNSGMTLLYWRGGRRISMEALGNKRADYGHEIVSTLSQQLRWSHFKEIIYLKNDLQREFYAEMCRVERWSVRTLREKIGSMLFERAAAQTSRARLINYQEGAE